MKFSAVAVFGFIPTIFAASLPNDLEKRAGGAYRSCEGPSFVQSGNAIIQQMTCGDGRGGKKISWINLSECIANRGGELVWQKNGNFGSTCYLDDGTNTGPRWNTDLYIWCPNGKGQVVSAAINLDERLVNRNGRLFCEV
ncbi:hypothetical protein TWF696_006745 [Orbilia brochopaga]|uniref:Cyanovirin-N domain-containing protein n=1 Tax=Orbilia brochopaga TaxID=3140254 RepID=A0AAV9UQP2_9PEZI